MIHALQIIQWQATGRVNIAGAIALATGVIIWITSLPQVRRKQFQLFFSAHHLYMVFILFFLIHAGDRHFYLVFAGVLLFALDKILRIIQSRKQTFLVSASILPCRAVKLTLPKHPCKLLMLCNWFLFCLWSEELMVWFDVVPQPWITPQQASSSSKYRAYPSSSGILSA